MGRNEPLTEEEVKQLILTFWKRRIDPHVGREM